jgi:hypothetical protein
MAQQTSLKSTEKTLVEANQQLTEETQPGTTATPSTATLFRNALTSSISLRQAEAS